MPQLRLALQQQLRSCSTEVKGVAEAAEDDSGPVADGEEVDSDEVDGEEADDEYDEYDEEPVPEGPMRYTSDMRPPKDTSRKWVKIDEHGRAYAVGRRKRAVARVYLTPVAPGAKRAATVLINKMNVSKFFGGHWNHRLMVLAPFFETGTAGQYSVMASVKGGGVTGQAQAIRHGIATALQGFDASLRPAMKKAGYLTRDSRQRERKKPGQRGARAKFAWVKR